MDSQKKQSIISAIKQIAGVDKHSEYVDNYMYATNMRASIYMSLLVIVLEIWMIIRLTKTIMI